MLRRGLILINGNIYTFDPELPHAKAMLALDGRVEYIGDDLDPEEMGINPQKSGGWMNVIDLEGRTVMPGFIDCHTHLLTYARSLREIDLRRARAISAIVKAVELKAEELRKGAWILGRGWNADRWVDEGAPDRRHLDKVSPQHPVFLKCHDEHAAWVNTLAIKVAGISGVTPNPPGGEIQRDPKTGEPTGLFKERAMDLIRRSIPEPSVSLQRDLMANALREVVRRGITSVYDHDGAEAFHILADLQVNGLLPIRVTESFRIESMRNHASSGLIAGFGNESLRVGGLKIFLDGSLSSRTAWMWEDYTDGSGRGAAQHSEQELEDIVNQAARERIPLVCHAIGDRAVSTALDLVEKYRQRESHPRLPHRIEHVQTIRPDDLPRLHKLDVTASMQPVHLLDDIEAAQKSLGERIAHTFAVKSLLDAAVTVAFGSDLPVAPFDPLLGVYAATQRRRSDGFPPEGFSLHQAISVEDALASYTCMAASSLGLSDRLGSLAEGRFADCVVLSQDPLKIKPEELLKTHVEMTIVDGRVVYDRRGMTHRELK